MSCEITGPSYVEIDNDFENAVFGNATVCEGYSGTRGLDALRVTLAHELFHVIQFDYYQGGDGSWWQEATATWMEDVIHPGVNDYLQYVCVFLQSPGRALDGGDDPRVDFHPYGASIFAFFLDQRYGREVVRRTWEEHGRRRSASLDNLDRALRDFQGEAGISGPEAGLERAFSDFAVWSWFVGDRHREEFFAEGDRYATREEPALPVSAGTEVSDSGAVDHMASRYLRFDPRLLPGGATIRIDQPRGRWRNRLLLAAPDGHEDLDLGDERTATVRGWDAWDEVVLVLSNVDLAGGHDYEVAVEYDPGLGGTPAGGRQPRRRLAQPLPAGPPRRGAHPLLSAPSQRRGPPHALRGRRPVGAQLRSGRPCGQAPSRSRLGRHQRIRAARRVRDLLRGAGSGGALPAAGPGRGARPLRRQAVRRSCSRRRAGRKPSSRSTSA